VAEISLTYLNGPAAHPCRRRPTIVGDGIDPLS
jgi:hypothetical protein